MAEEMISIENLRKDYGSLRAVSDISFSVPRGQVIGFLGPNGAGKSTTMKILTGYVMQTAGIAKVAGVDVATNREAARRHIGYLSESNPLYEDMMVYEYLNYIAGVRGLSGTSATAAIKKAVERCGLGEKIGADIGELSKGYRQRVGLAQALLHEPELLILDEPTTGLDPNQVVEIRELIKELGREKTVLMSTHIMPEVQATCSRVIIIANGELVADDAPDRLAQSGSKIDIEFLPQQNVLIDTLRNKLLKIDGVEKVDTLETIKDYQSVRVHISGQETDEKARREMATLLLGEGCAITKCERETISLEDVFRQLTQTEQKTPQT